MPSSTPKPAHSKLQHSLRFDSKFFIAACKESVDFKPAWAEFVNIMAEIFLGDSLGAVAKII